MRLESVRDLKLEAVEIVRRLERDRAPPAFLGRPAIATRRARGPRPSIALGITTNAKAPDGYQLAVRIQRPQLQQDYPTLANLSDLSHGELEVKYVGTVRPRWQRGRHRPLLIGTSIAHHAITAGTLGAFPRQRSDGQRVVLSNAHVLALDGLAEPGDEILQPGPLDGGRSPADQIGRLLKTAPLDPSGVNLVDAAICSLGDQVYERIKLRGFGDLLGARAHPADIGEAVNKIGRTTGFTQGRVTAIEMDDLVVEMEEIGATRFDRQIEIEGIGAQAFSDGGDSGSLIFDHEGWAVGLLFAGSELGGANGMGLTYANDIQAVLDALDLELDV